MKTLVTGGAGFIGSHIAERLIKEGHEVFILDDLSAGKLSNIPGGVVAFYQDSITNIDKRYLSGIDVVFHNAASKKNVCLVDPVKDIHVNGGGTLNLLLACKEAGVKSFVHASTGSVYGQQSGIITEDSPTLPVSYYGISKLAGEKYVLMFRGDMDVSVLRYFHVYGERQESDPELGGVVSIFKNQISKGDSIVIYGDGTQERLFTSVHDVVDANIRAWEHSKLHSGHIYNCAANETITIKQLADMLIGDKKIEIKYKPSLVGDIHDFNIDNSKIKILLDMKFNDFNPFYHE